MFKAGDETWLEVPCVGRCEIIDFGLVPGQTNLPVNDEVFFSSIAADQIRGQSHHFSTNRAQSDIQKSLIINIV